MSEKTKAAVSEAASKNSETRLSKKQSAKSTRQDKAHTSKKRSDSKYHNPFSYDDATQCKLVNCIMKEGKKSIAQKILKDSFDELNRKGEKNTLKTFQMAIENVKPTMEVKAKRIGGAVYQIPLEVLSKRQQSLSIRWILEGARKKKGIPMYKRLALEFLDAANKSGYAFNKKEETHKMAQANKAFAHLARY